MEAGNDVAVRNYAVFLLNGIGTGKRDPDGAREILEKAVRGGDGEAALTLSSLYAQDNGIGPDEAKMVENLKRAAELGSVGGQQALGQLYLGGAGGVEKNPGKAL
ncbi:MAG: sel1 repeat family protein, partial [Akkermansiaceae bacterium]|nr:sel1 repeat family protein [Akkermansiaceae bacterium]